MPRTVAAFTSYFLLIQFYRKRSINSVMPVTWATFVGGLYQRQTGLDTVTAKPIRLAWRILCLRRSAISQSRKAPG
jgi:hypothetical protein